MFGQKPRCTLVQEIGTEKLSSTYLLEFVFQMQRGAEAYAARRIDLTKAL
jgi:hypothetical protein